MLDKNLEKFSCQRKTVRRPSLSFYNMVDAAANNAYTLMKKSGRYSKSKKCFLKNLSFQLAKSAVENRLRLSIQKYGVRDAAAQIDFSIPTESNVTPCPTVSSHQERCRVCKTQTRSRCRPGARIAWKWGINKFGGAQKVHCFECKRVDQKPNVFIPNFHKFWGED